MRCSPFDDQKVFNAQVAEKWKARSDPESVAKLKTLVNCLALRRPKTTIELLPRKDEIVYLDFSREEWEDYKRVKSQTLYNIDNVQESGSVKFLNALKWVNELRLMCTHGLRNPKETQPQVVTPPAWSVHEAQVRFDQLEEVGLAKCSSTGCCQDLSSALSSETGAEHEDDPWISESLELWCSLCFKSRGKADSTVLRICNHLPRRFQKQDSTDEDGKAYLRSESSVRSNLVTAKTDKPLPTKVKMLLQHLLEAPEDTKRFVPRSSLHSERLKFESQRHILLLDQNIRHHSAPALGTFDPLCPARRHPFRQQSRQRPPRLSHTTWYPRPPRYDILRRYRARLDRCITRIYHGASVEPNERIAGT